MVVKDIMTSNVIPVASEDDIMHAIRLMRQNGIRQRILADLDNQKWAMPNLINVVVRDGVVDLWGTITDERTRGALIVLAENAPGVKAVRDHTVWAEPISGMIIGPGSETDARTS